VLGLWAGNGGGESAKFWMNVLTDLKNRGVRDVFFVVCDGLKGLPDSVNAVFPQAIVQACVIHLIRATLRYASRTYWDQLATDLRRIYTAWRRRGGLRRARGDTEFHLGRTSMGQTGARSRGRLQAPRVGLLWRRA
jgi:transposase-like protein